MRISKVNEKDLNKALKKVNKKYDNNIVWNNFEQISTNSFRITLKCKDSKKAGHRLGFSTKNPFNSNIDMGRRRRLINACWHVHGHFFEALLKINENAVIYAGTQRIDKDGGNWEDRNIGSQIEPLMFSEACECG